MFLNSIHNIIKTSERLGKICECKQPYSNDVRYGMSIRFLFFTSMSVIKFCIYFTKIL